ncbi:MAG: hypothetical protein JWO20_608 [Candidatus Angelobacter sp.]|jgi:hypothetical protein|nr:hypothetical protein [Candidatus Angelobacter sp.]
MSYDLYCYSPVSSLPNAVEAEALLNSEESGINADDILASDRKQRVAAALMEYNPRLEMFNFDYTKIAESRGISEDAARKKWNQIELNAPKGDPAIQFTIYDNHIDVSIPYWYQGVDADRIFSQLSSYLRVIRKATGYFVYDPQTGLAFDPEKHDFGTPTEYEKVVKKLPEIAADAVKGRRKSWWKFW